MPQLRSLRSCFRCYGKLAQSSLPPRLSGPNNDPDAPLHPDWYHLPTGESDIDPSYPRDIPFHSYQTRPYERGNQLRRRWGEPVHEEYEVLSVQSFDVETTYSIPYMLTGCLGFIGTVGLLGWAWTHLDNGRSNAYRIPVVN